MPIVHKRRSSAEEPMIQKKRRNDNYNSDATFQHFTCCTSCFKHIIKVNYFNILYFPKIRFEKGSKQPEFKLTKPAVQQLQACYPKQ